MKESDLPAGLSWKRGFLFNKSKGKTSIQALPQVVAKRIKEKHCSHFEKTQNESQRNFLTWEVVPDHPDSDAATDPAPHSLLNVTIAPTPNLGQCKGSGHHNSTATVPQTSLTHADGHIHRTLPVRGLPLERAHIDDTLAITHNVQESKTVSTTEKLTVSTIEQLGITNGPGVKHTRNEPCKLTTAATATATDQQQISVEPPPPPPPLDANDGPEAVMRAIDAWLDYQDYLKTKPALSQSHGSDAEEKNTTFHLSLVSNQWNNSQMHIGAKPLLQCPQRTEVTS